MTTDKNEPEAEYRQTVTMCALAARALLAGDIPEMLNAISRAYIMGPLLDPTAWMKNARKMQEDKELLEAALPLWKWAQKVKNACTPTTDGE